MIQVVDGLVLGLVHLGGYLGIRIDIVAMEIAVVVAVVVVVVEVVVVEVAAVGVLHRSVSLIHLPSFFWYNVSY